MLGESNKNPWNYGKIISFFLSLGFFSVSKSWISLTTNPIWLSIFEMLSYVCFTFVISNITFKIEKEEKLKFVSLASMMFGIIFVYSLLRSFKDAIVIGYGGAEASTSTKLFVLFFTAAYQLVAQWLVFYLSPTQSLVMLFPLITYFIIFGYFLIGNTSVLPSLTFVGKLQSYIPFLHDIFNLLLNWPSVLYYIFVEIYGVMAVQLFFWKNINKNLTSNESQRFIPSIGILSQIAGMLAAIFSMICIKKSGFVNTNGTIFSIKPLKATAILITKITILVNLAIVGISYYFFNNFSIERIAEKENTTPKIKERISLFTSIIENPGKVFIASYVMIYGLITFSLEQVFKGTIAKENKTSMKYFDTNSFIMFKQSVIAYYFSLIGHFIIDNFPWIVSATITPAVAIFASFAVFGKIIFVSNEYIAGFCNYFGSIGVALLKGTSYVVDQPTNQIFLVALNTENKNLIKDLETALSRAGKALGAVIMSIVFGLGHQFGVRLGYNTPAVALAIFIAINVLSSIWFFRNMLAQKMLPKDFQKKE